MDKRWQHNTYLVRKKFFTMFGGKFSVFDPDGNLIFYSSQKAFKLKEDIRIYTGEDMQTEVLSIMARSILDFSAAYDVIDTPTGQRVGTLKRRGMKSLIKDTWLILDENETEIGQIEEDNLILALVRRFVLEILPQSFHATVQGQVACTFAQNWNPFISKITIEFNADHPKPLDRRLGLAATILLCAVEGKQE